MKTGFLPSLQMVIDMKVGQNVLVMDLDITNGGRRAIIDIQLHLDEHVTELQTIKTYRCLIKLDQTQTSQLKLERT